LQRLSGTLCERSLEANGVTAGSSLRFGVSCCSSVGERGCGGMSSRRRSRQHAINPALRSPPCNLRCNSVALDGKKGC